MYRISFTTESLNIRSSPFDPVGETDQNLIATLPSQHPVTLLGERVEGWIFVRTVFQNSRLEGYVAVRYLRDGGGLTEPVPSTPAVPQRDAILLDLDSAALKEHLTIKKPADDVGGMQALSIKRSRRVEVSLSEVMNPNLTASYSAQPAMGFKEVGNFDYFVSHWMRLWNDKIPSIADKFFTEDSYVVPRVSRKPAVNSNGATVAGSWGNRWVDLVAEWSPPANGFAIHHPVAQRSFLLVPKQGEQIVALDFISVEAFRGLLNTKIDSLQQCARDSNMNKLPQDLLTEATSVDLGPALILRQSSELDSIKNFTSKLSETADNLGVAAVTQLLDESQVNGLIRAVMTMKAPDVERALRKSELVDRASALGYKLAVEQEKFNFEDGSSFDLEPGKLYRPYQTQIAWVSEHRRQSSWSSSGFFGIGGGGGTREWTEFVQHFKTVTKYEKVRVDLDPFSDEEEWLASKGFENFRFERVGNLYRTAEGIDLDEVMYRCEYDESFRVRCAVWLPVYEQKISKGLMVTKYHIIKRPHMGIQPVRMPQVYFEETLAYRTSWVGAELGELVYTMNLAPGEDRTLTVEQRTSRSSEDVRSTVSILDLTETSSQELSTEIEKEARTTSEQSSSNSWSASASGSYKGFSGSASSSGENKTSTSQFARSFERIAKKAASNITRNTRQEVRSSSTMKTEASRTESTTIKIKNINEGRTLNLLFYRLYNILATGLHAEDLGFVSESGIEAVAGSGITIPRVLSVENLPDAFAPFDIHRLPFSISAALGSQAYAATYLAYWHLVIRKFLNLLNEEYVPTSGEPGLLGRMDSDDQKLYDELQLAIKPRLVAAGTEVELVDQVKQLLSRLDELMSSLTQKAGLDNSPELAGRKKIRVASPGLYVDSLMGLRPATEPYAEEMRAQAVLMKSAEAEKERALAAYYRRMGGENSTAPSGGAIVDGLVKDSTVIFTSNVPLASGVWVFVVDGRETGSLDWAIGARECSMQVANSTWQNDLNAHLYFLRHRASNQSAALVVRLSQ